MKRFPALALEDISIDIMGEFVKTKRGNKSLLFIVDRYSNFVRTVPLASTKGYDVTRAFVQHWVFTY